MKNKLWSSTASLTLIFLMLSACGDMGTTTESAEETTTAPQKFEENWESLANYEIPEWFADSKFGIFIHWGAYSVPAYGSEWYPRLMYMDEKVWSAQFKVGSEKPSHVYKHHIEKYGTLKDFGYKDFIPMFKGENFDAKNWIDLFKKAGARYVVPVAEHHDGFAMYDSKITRWNAVDMGPKQDILGELFKEGRKQGLHMGASSHFAFNWAFFNKRDHFDTVDPEYSDLYSKKGTDDKEPPSEEFKELWWSRTKDIIDNYQPDVLWMDFYLDQDDFKAYHPKLASYYYNKGIEWGKEVVLQDKNLYYEAFPEGTIVYDLERGKMAGINKLPWQTDTSLGKNSWGYVTNWESKEANTVVDDLIDIVSKNGCVLLNVGPKSDGTIPADQAETLLEIGDWLIVNGDAIYDTRCWKVFGEGPTESEEGYMSEKAKQDKFVAEDIRFTTKNGKLYAIALDWPSNGQLEIKSLGKKDEHCQWDAKSVRMLGNDEELQWSQSDKSLMIELPTEKPNDYAYAFEIDFGEFGEEATKNYISMKSE